MLALILFLMLVMAAFAVDIGNRSLVRSQLQTAVDAANYAAASGMPYGPAEVRARAKAAAAANTVNGQPLVLLDSDIQLGTWDATKSPRFTILTGSAESGANCVRIVGQLTAARGNPVQHFFGSVVGDASSDLTVKSVAGGSAGGDIVIVQDITNSFSDELADAKVADHALVDALYNNGKGGASIGIAVHTGWGKTLLPLTPIKTGYTTIKSTVTNIKLAGNTGMPVASGTDISAGLLEGMKVFANTSSKSSGQGATKVIVLVSDGEPNANSKGSNPTLNNTQLLALARQRADEAWAQKIHIYIAFFNRENSQSAANNVKSLVRGKGYFAQTTDANKLKDILNQVATRLPVQLLD